MITKERETNVEFLTRVCEFSKAGAVGQLFAIEAIYQVAEEVSSIPLEDYLDGIKEGTVENPPMHARAWWRAASDWKTEIEKKYN
jgi:hypothetical protein